MGDENNKTKQGYIYITSYSLFIHSIIIGFSRGRENKKRSDI